MSTSRKICFILAFCLAPLMASGDVLMLKDGQTISGKFQGADQTSVSFTSDGQTRKYAISEINSITFTSPAPQAAAPPAQASSPTTPPTLKRRSDQETTTRATTPKKLGVTVHAGSLVTVRMIDPVDSSTDEIGQTYRASLDEPLLVDGEVVVSRGADVTAKLVSKAEAGRLKGRSELILVLMDITINGRKHEITTSEVSQAGASRGKQTATRAGIGAALGAAIGGIAGGGKGAAVGAATGAGAGTAIQIATHGEQVRIPPETRLEFTLAQPLNL